MEDYMTGAEQTFLVAVLAAFAVFAFFVVRANNASEEYRKTH
jgi:hypothetical protein